MDRAAQAGQAVQRQLPCGRNASGWRNAPMLEEEDAKPKLKRLQELNLYSLGVAEMTAYIGELNAEIARVSAEIERKRGHRSAADAFFKPS
jgi:uncharacterized small protein (DUF1192 family)